MTGKLVEITDAVRAILPTPDGITAEPGATEPFLSAPGRLYVWPRRLSPTRLEELNGRFDEATVRLRILYTVAAKGEARVIRPERAVSELLADLVDLAHEALDANRRHPLWWDLYVENVVPDAVRTPAIRGHGIDLAVRINAPAALIGASGS